MQSRRPDIASITTVGAERNDPPSFLEGSRHGRIRSQIPLLPAGNPETFPVAITSVASTSGAAASCSREVGGNGLQLGGSQGERPHAARVAIDP